ncbi:hypothetical protein CERSUDRAFT_95820 [Gelatoporia subvermispora B]|uniref:Uncharacterized protein n=1 Tax=Ceriporiopsis subvermispora (strain B) TaxID=914234 RepID=M2QWM3_CERS8|nr:hypothetical protein CERSUDRAFT_95820 [Gelatoporia subvermispora B]
MYYGFDADSEYEISLVGDGNVPLRVLRLLAETLETTNTAQATYALAALPSDYEWRSCPERGSVQRRTDTAGNDLTVLLSGTIHELARDDNGVVCIDLCLLRERDIMATQVEGLLPLDTVCAAVVPMTAGAAVADSDLVKDGYHGAGVDGGALNIYMLSIGDVVTLNCTLERSRRHPDDLWDIDLICGCVYLIHAVPSFEEDLGEAT